MKSTMHTTYSTANRVVPLVNTSPPSIARGGISTHADLRPPELESGALDHSATRASILINSGKKKKETMRHTETSSHFMSLSSPSNGTVFVPQTLQCPKCQITIVPFLRHHTGLMSDDYKSAYLCSGLPFVTLLFSVERAR